MLLMLIVFMLSNFFTKKFIFSSYYATILICIKLTNIYTIYIILIKNKKYIFKQSKQLHNHIYINIMSIQTKEIYLNKVHDCISI